MIPVIMFLVSGVVWACSGVMAFMFMDSSDFWSTTFLLINRLAIISAIFFLVWALWLATGLTLTVS